MNETSRFASRKFLVTLLVLAIGVGMELAGELSAQLVDLLKWGTGLYFGFNVGQKSVEWVSDAVSLSKVTKAVE